MSYFKEALTNAVSLFKELEDLIPSVETKFTYSSLDEGLIENKTIDGIVTETKYYLKRAVNGKKFNFEHTLAEGDDIHSVRETSWKQHDAWLANIENVIENTKELNNK